MLGNLFNKPDDTSKIQQLNSAIEQVFKLGYSLCEIDVAIKNKNYFKETSVSSLKGIRALTSFSQLQDIEDEIPKDLWVKMKNIDEQMGQITDLDQKSSNDYNLPQSKEPLAILIWIFKQQALALSELYHGILDSIPVIPEGEITKTMEEEVPDDDPTEKNKVKFAIQNLSNFFSRFANPSILALLQEIINYGLSLTDNEKAAAFLTVLGSILRMDSSAGEKSYVSILYSYKMWKVLKPGDGTLEGEALLKAKEYLTQWYKSKNEESARALKFFEALNLSSEKASELTDAFLEAPLSETLLPELESLFSHYIVALPVAGVHAWGGTFFGSLTIVDESLFFGIKTPDQEKYNALIVKIMIVMLHELTHKKKALYLGKDHFKTPEKFDQIFKRKDTGDSTGRLFEKFTFGKEILIENDLPENSLSQMVSQEKFSNTVSPQFKKIFSPKSYNQSQENSACLSKIFKDLAAEKNRALKLILKRRGESGLKYCNQ